MISINKNLLIILVLAFCYANLIAQNDKKAIELKDYFWKASGSDFKVTEIPQKWKDKSAVIIARSFEKHYRKRRVGGLEYFDYEHYRIKIQSTKALEDYAEFSFPESSTFVGYGVQFYVGYKIIKPDGREIEVSLKDAVVSEMKVNRYELNMLKLAIPNLEIGDIVDFYIAEEQHIPPVDKFYSFDPTIYTLVGSYPIMKQKITFDIERKCYLNAKSLNGAPEFTIKNTGNDYFYVLEDEDRDNYKGSKWTFPYRQLPTIKFKVVYAKGTFTSSSLFLGEQGIIKNEVSKAEIVSYYKNFITRFESKGLFFAKKMKKLFKGRKDKNELAKDIYYHFRNYYVINNVENLIQRGGDQNEIYNNFALGSILCHVYDAFDIDVKLLVGTARSVSTIQDIMLENEMIAGLKVNNDIIIADFDNYSLFGTYPYLLEGTEVYEFYNKNSVNITEVPISTADDNNTSKVLTYTIKDLDNDESTAEITTKIVGYNKEIYQEQLLDFYDYKSEEVSKYKMQEFSNPSKKKIHAKYIQKKEAYITEMEQTRLDDLKILTESEYDLEIKKVADFVINSNGRHDEQPEFEFTYNADLEGVINKAGNDYLVSIGKLIDGQIKLEKEDLERDYDIYMSFPRSYNFKIIVNIPEGYSVEGIENLTNDVQTDAGGFVSSAKVEGNQIILEARKYYNTNFVKQENWDTMKTFLTAAENFNTKSVLLKAN